MPEQVSETMDSVRDSTSRTIENIDFDFDRVQEQISSLYSSIVDSGGETEQEDVAPPELTAPDEQFFSIGNVELGDSREAVEEMYGEPKRESENEYGVNWSAYHENYQNFMMVAYDDEETVRGLYTNQDLLSSQSEIALGAPQVTVNEILGEPEEVVSSGDINYQINDESAYDVYQVDGDQATIFYDIHQEDQVTAIQLIDEELEAGKDTPYASGSEPLGEGLEYQLFDLTNAARAKHDLPALEWHEEASDTAGEHSADMAENDYFSHQNLDGQSPFDRMEEDDISFTTAGENLAAGQFSSIYAHHGLMNSEGHRENILHDSFSELGIGVEFNGDNHPFYTEKFLSSQWLN